MTGWIERVKLFPLVVLLKFVRLCIALSSVFVWAYFMSVALVLPIQQAALPETIISALFLPHGVRVLSAWLYNWRSALYIAPGALLCGVHFAGQSNIGIAAGVGVFCSLLVCPLAFSVTRFVFGPDILKVGQVRVPMLLAVGILAAAFDLLALTIILDLDPLDSILVLIGDTGGLIVALVILWLGMKMLPRRG